MCLQCLSNSKLFLFIYLHYARINQEKHELGCTMYKKNQYWFSKKKNFF